MTSINYGTKKHAQAIWTWENCYKGNDVESAYRTRPSYDKISSFNKIWQRAHQTKGYNHDLKVVSANCYFYSTMYSFTDEKGWTFIVYDTHANTYLIPYKIGE